MHNSYAIGWFSKLTLLCLTHHNLDASKRKTEFSLQKCKKNASKAGSHYQNDGRACAILGKRKEIQSEKILMPQKKNIYIYINKAIKKETQTICWKKLTEL